MRRARRIGRDRRPLASTAGHDGNGAERREGQMTVTGAPTVSICMPVHNGENFIADAIDSIVAQTFPDFELIVTDNASTDRTEPIVRDFARRDGRIRYVRNEENIGAAANYNLGYELSRGRYVKWAAHDDTLSPNFLERTVP